MSLQVWLPLNGSAINQGVAGFQPAAADMTYDNSGKIGAKCYSGGSIKMSAAQTSSVFNNEALTIAFWIKPTKASKNGIIFGNNSNRQFSLFQYTGNTSTTSHGLSLHWSWHTTSGSGNNYDAAGNATASSNTWLNNIFIENAWSHVCVVYSKTLLQIYINGILRADRAMSGSASSFEYETYLINNEESSDRRINDLRVYDHALSPREVKLLAQGLVAHYKLDDGQPNLIKHGAEEKSGSGYCVAKYAFDKDGFGRYLNPGEQCSLTVCFTPHANFDYWFPHLNQGDIGGWIANPETTGKSDETTNCQIVTMKSTTNWNYYNSASQVVSANDDRAEICMFAKNKGGAENNANVTIHWIKLQTGSHTDVRTFSPSLTENASLYNMEYDCSGYGNHGTKSAILEASTGSPRYSCAALFKDNKYIQTTRNNYEGMKNTYSMVYWAKHPTSSMNGKMVWGFYDGTNGKYLDLYPSGGKFTLNKGDSSNLSFNVDCPTDGLWHHYAVVGDINKVYLYMDGQYKGETSGLYQIPNAPLVLSGWNTWETSTYGWNNGHISDFRLYATALSAPAVKELYQSSISFLDNGTLQCSEIIESPTNLKYNQNGITQAELVSEIGYTNKMKVKEVDGKIWARIHWLNLQTDKTYFQSEAEVLECINASNRFSLMKYVDKFKSKEGKYEFMLTYPLLSATGYNSWTQTESPNVNYGTNVGYVKGRTDFPHDSQVGPLTYTHSSFRGSSMYSANKSSNWWSPVGQKTLYGDGIPASTGATTYETELWVRIDNLPKLTKLSMLDDAIQAFQIYEL